MSLHIDIRAAAALVALGGKDLVVMLAQIHAVPAPGVEVVLHVDGSARALLGADGPVLLEGPGAVDRGLVGPGGDVDVIGAAVGLELALVLGLAAGVVGAVGLDDVVLYEWVARPAVDAEVAVALGIERAAVVDCPIFF